MSTPPRLPETTTAEPSQTPPPGMPQSPEMLESVAFAAMCSCIVTSRLLLKKGLITPEEYAADLDENAKLMAETILYDRDTRNFFEAIRLLRESAK